MDVLEHARQELGLSVSELWWRYFALGGMSSEMEVEAMLQQALVATVPDRDLLAAALNERYRELRGDHPLGYGGDDSADT